MWLLCPASGTGSAAFLMVHPQNVGFQKRQVLKTSGFKTSETSGLQNVRFTKCQVYKTSGLQNVRLQKNIHTYSVLVVGENPKVLLQPCLQAKWWLCFIIRGSFCPQGKDQSLSPNLFGLRIHSLLRQLVPESLARRSSSLLALVSTLPHSSTLLFSRSPFLNTPPR